MLNAVLLGLVRFSAQTGAAAQSSGAGPVTELRVVVAAPVYQPDGAVSAETLTLANGAPSVVHMFGRRSLCDSATAGVSEPGDAAFGWRLTAHTVSATESTLVVGIDWRRLWERGQKLANGPSGTVQLKLHPGDRIPLDHIPNPAATDACPAVGMGLEVRLARALAPAPANIALLPLGSTEHKGRAIDAELWLVHTLPSGSQQAHHQTVRLADLATPFSFAPVKVTTTRGEVAVDITGSFRRYQAPTGIEILYVSLARKLAGGALPADGVTGSTGAVMALPGATEVLSLELTAPASATGGEGGVARRGGGGGGARSPGGFIGGGGAGGTGAAAGGARQGGPTARGRVGPPGTGPGPGGNQTIGVLEGHAFSLRFRLTPVPVS